MRCIDRGRDVTTVDELEVGSVRSGARTAALRSMDVVEGRVGRPRERVGAKSASNYICIRNQRREAAACAGDLALESRTAD